VVAADLVVGLVVAATSRMRLPAVAVPNPVRQHPPRRLLLRPRRLHLLLPQAHQPLLLPADQAVADRQEAERRAVVPGDAVALVDHRAVVPQVVVAVAPTRRWN
jgi:hypothetical protein